MSRMSTSRWSRPAPELAHVAATSAWRAAAEPLLGALRPRQDAAGGALGAESCHYGRMTQLSDGTLVKRVLDGDREVFGALVERHQDRMIAYARHMGFGPAEAKDIVQDGFIRAFRHLRRCGDPERFSGWLFRIVSNLCRTMASRSARKRNDPLEAHAPTLVSEVPGPEERMMGAWTRVRVRAALDEVPPEQREALVLMYLEGYSVAEIGELTGASVSAVKMRLKRGRDALQDALGPLLTEMEEA